MISGLNQVGITDISYHPAATRVRPFDCALQMNFGELDGAGLG
jgi:hypothetical protein